MFAGADDEADLHHSRNVKIFPVMSPPYCCDIDFEAYLSCALS
jgi:hypothetical protein